MLKKSVVMRLHTVTNYKGHVIRDTLLRLVKFLKKIRDRLLHGIEFIAILDTLTLILP